MSCDICGRSSCTESFHSLEEQKRYEKVCEAFERARQLRQQVRDQMDEEEAEELAVPELTEEQKNQPSPVPVIPWRDYGNPRQG